MKKILSVVTVIAMLAASTTAFAAAPETVKNEDGSYTTSGVDAAYANKMMTILAYTEGQPIGVDSIQYIDQTTANASGNYSFANYAPIAEPTGTTRYVVKVGGQGIATPLDAGYITAPVSQNISITGTVTTTGTVTPATITLADPAGVKADITASTNPATGQFTIEAPAGTYNLTVAKSGHTKYIYNGFVLSAAIADAAYTLYAGDANADGIIGVTDLSAIIAVLKAEVTSANKSIDVNDDNVIGVTDLSATIANLKKTNTTVSAQ